MSDLRRFTMMRGFSGNPDKLSRESAGLEQKNRRQLAGLRFM
jgi:hypothetical protein